MQIPAIYRRVVLTSSFFSIYAVCEVRFGPNPSAPSAFIASFCLDVGKPTETLRMSRETQKIRSKVS